MPEQQKPEQDRTEPIIRHEDYTSLYANNVQFQPWEWDLRISFGELDVREGKLVIEQHTAINVSWLQAKIMRYFLDLQLDVYELQNGKIKIPAAVFPAAPTPPTGDLANDPIALRVFEIIKQKHAELVRESAAGG